MRGLPDNAFDLVIADPPYGGANNPTINGGGGSVSDSTGTGQPRLRREVRKIQCSRTGGTWAAKFGGGIIAWDTAPNEDFFNELFRVSKEQVIWGANYFPNMPATRCFLVWRKQTISEKFTMAMAEYAWTSFNGNAKVFEYPPQGKNGDRFHPTQKPVELYAWVLRMFAKSGDRIFDPMMGSQSSRIAAYKLGYDFCGCELDKEYFEKGCERFERECHGITKMQDGTTVRQLSLFDD